MIRRALALVFLLSCLALPAPAAPPPSRVAEADPAQVETVLFLIGDAGQPARRGEPVLQALGRDLARDPARSFVVFLGDNLYRTGLGPPDDPQRAEMERRIDTQVDAVKAAGARAVFVPGNHDWGGGEGKDGWDSVRRQQQRVDARGAPLVSFWPKDGCPGPDTMDVGSQLRLVFLDTQWWLRQGPKPVDPTSSCPADSPDEVVAGLREALASAGERKVIVHAHHPLRSGGPHGGYFSLREHLFPLTDAKRWLWLPLPLLGSIYPMVRRAGSSTQDLSNAINQKMCQALEDAFHDHPPWVYASGHEHALQVIEGGSARYLLVSGAGIYAHESDVRALEGTRFASSNAGYLRLDVTRRGSARLGVVEVDKKGAAVEVYSEWLQP